MEIITQISRQLDLDDAGQETLRRVLATQNEIASRQREVDALIAIRRADVLGLHARWRVSKYRLAEILGVSQTTIGNITRESPNDE